MELGTKTGCQPALVGQAANQAMSTSKEGVSDGLNGVIGLKFEERIRHWGGRAARGAPFQPPLSFNGSNGRQPVYLIPSEGKDGYRRRFKGGGAM